MVVTSTDDPAPPVDDTSPVRSSRALTRVEAVVVAGVVLAGIVFRFWTSSRMWLDEALTVDIARLPLKDIPGALRQDGHPPLYYFLLHGWMRVFGQGDLAARSLAGVSGVLTLPLAWLAGKRLGGARVGWAAVVLLSLSPFAIRYATENRMYSLVMVLVLVGYLMVDTALREPTWPRLAGVAVVSGLLLLTHYWALWFLAAVVAVLAWRAWRGGADVRRATVRVLVAVLVGGVLLVPWLGVMRYQSQHTGTPWAAPVRPTTMISKSVLDLGGGGTIEPYGEAVLLGFGLLTLFLLGLFGRERDESSIVLDLRTVPRVRREALVIGITLAIATVAGYATHTTFATRYVSVVFPLFVLVAAVGLRHLDLPVVRGVVLSGVILFGVVGGVHNVTTERTEAGVISSAIDAGVKPGDLVVICPDQLGPAVHRLLPASVRQVVYPTFADPDRVDWRDYGARNAAADPAAFATRVTSEAAGSGASSVWLVASGSYNTLEGQCEALTSELGVRLGAGTSVVTEDSSNYFEHAALFRFPGHAGAPAG